MVSTINTPIKATSEREWMVMSPSYTEKYDDGDRNNDSPKIQLANAAYNDRITITYRFPEARVKKVGSFNESLAFVSVTMDGLPEWEIAGSPVLPFKTAEILLPPGKLVRTFRVVGGRKIDLPGLYLVKHGEEDVPLSSREQALAHPKAFLNETIYSSDDPYPSRLHSGISVQSKMGYRILMVNLHPVRFIPKSAKIYYYESITVEVELSPETEEDSFVTSGHQDHRTTVRAIVDNPEILESYPTPMQTSSIEYVIITNEELANTTGPYNFQALRDEKVSRGINATIVTTDWIYTNYDGTRPDGGTDNQTKIRNFIIDAYQNWSVRYVLLGGDGDGWETGEAIIPHRGLASVSVEIDYDIPADMYFACLDGTFDYDGDGIYGEPNDGPSGGEIDLFAEVYVGRACVDRPEEVQNFVRKTLSYQNASVDQNFRKAWMVGENLGFGGIAEWGGNYKDEIKVGATTHGYTTVGFENSAYSASFDVSTLYDRDHASYNWPKTDLIHLINDNAHLINHMGHANVGYVMKMINSDVDTLLTNDQLYFIGYSQGCYSGAFDGRTTSPGTYTNYDCISEHLTTEAHGAVAFISNSRYGWGKRYSTDGASQHFDREFWDAVFGETILNLGIANQDAKEDNAGRIGSAIDRYCYYEINLFGDPELRIKLPDVAEHELEVELHAPIILEPNDSWTLEAVVNNRGLNNESNVELNLMINGTTVRNETILAFEIGASHAINYSWGPLVEGVYNVTASVLPVPFETNIENNRQSQSILVQFYPKILLVDDNDGNNSINGTSVLEFESILNGAGKDFLVWNESSMGNPSLDFLSRFELVIWSCGDYWNEAVDSIDSITLESYVAGGGSLFLEGEDIGYDHRSDRFMVNVAHAIYQTDHTGAPGLTVTESSHLVTSGLPASFLWDNVPPFDDGIAPTDTGMEVIHYTGTSWTAVTVYEGERQKVVFCAFPLYCLEGSTLRTLVLNSIDWLMETPGILGWTDYQAVCPEYYSSAETRPSMTTDSEGWLYVAYEHYNSATGYYDIGVSYSIDSGVSWGQIYDLSWSNNLRYPSIAIDVGDGDNLYVAFEREWTSNDHDIFVLRRIGSTWSTSPVANVLGSDDRYPSITSEYQYGVNDRQYISYEYVYSYDDRDLMFAQSQDDGATWSKQKLHGNWPDGNVHSQTCITTARGSDGNDYIYIAYKWGASSASAYDVVLDKSSNRGMSWTQQWICDESSRTKNWPSIAATRGGDVVVVAWHVYYDSTFLNDIQYAYSTDSAGSWHVGWLALEASVDERTPTLAVDGQDSTNPYTSGYIHLAYWRDREIHYRQAHFSSPWSWTPTEQVTDTASTVSSVYTTPALTTYRSHDGPYIPAVTWTNYNGTNYDIYYSTKSILPIYIRADGSVDPPNAPLLNCNNTVYTLSGSTNAAIIVERSNITVDGASYRIRGTGATYERGVDLTSGRDVTIKELRITSFGFGIYSLNSSGTVICGNNLTNNYYGIYMFRSGNSKICGNSVTNSIFSIYLDGSVYMGGSGNNTICGNSVTNSTFAIYLYESNSNSIYHNNFADNLEQVTSVNSTNSWDNGYPSGGNYWSDYNGTDLYRGPDQNETGHDWIGDAPYIIDEYNEDRYPLIVPWSGARPVVRFYPETLVLGPENVIGQTITVAVVIEDVVDLAGLDSKISWNPAYLEYVNHTLTVPFEDYTTPIPPSPYGGIIHAPILLLKDEVNTTAGTFWVAFTNLGGPSFNGSGSVVIITFKVLQQPNAGENNLSLPLHFTSVDLATSIGESIPCEIRDGFVIVEPRSEHDIAVTNITSSREIVGRGYLVAFNVTLENQSIENEVYSVAVHANGTQIASGNSTLMGLETSTITLAWNTTGLAYGNYSITVYVTPLPGETDIADNTLVDGWVFITIPGDADGDQDVDIYDIVQLAAQYGQTLPLTWPIPPIDIDGDGDIDIFDIVVAAGNYGKSW